MASEPLALVCFSLSPAFLKSSVMIQGASKNPRPRWLPNALNLNKNITVIILSIFNKNICVGSDAKAL